MHIRGHMLNDEPLPRRHRTKRERSWRPNNANVDLREDIFLKGLADGFVHVADIHRATNRHGPAADTQASSDG